MSDIILSNVDNGKTIALTSGQKLILQLSENPTTGYRWSLPMLKPEILRLVDDRFDLSSPVAMGSGGQRILTFQANHPGQLSLNLKNRREWEEEASAIGSFNLLIQVSESK